MASVAVGNRVCTTDVSSAKSSTTVRSTAAPTGLPCTAVTATWTATAARRPRSAVSTSVVVPERVSATILS